MVDHQPVTITRRRARFSDAETGARMLHAAVQVLHDHGLTVSLEHVSFEEVVRLSGVARSSAYRRWPNKDQFLSELLVTLAQGTQLTAEPPGLIAELSDLLDAAPLDTEQERRDLVVEGFRRSLQADLQRLVDSPQWRTYIAVTATVSGLPAGPVRDLTATAVGAAEQRFNAHRAHVYERLAGIVGYRVVPGVSYLQLAEVMGAAMTGYLVKCLATPELLQQSEQHAAFGSTVRAAWSSPAYGLTAVLLALFEPDPDADWSPAALVVRRVRWRELAKELSEVSTLA